MFSRAQQEEQEHFMSLERRLCVTCAKMKIAKIYAFQNPVNERIMLQHYPPHPTFTLVYICNLCSRFTICLISTCNYIVIERIIISLYYKL